MNVEVKLMRIQGQAAVVTYRDNDGMLLARIISRDAVAGLRRGATETISKKVLDSGTEYGIDWEVLLDEDTYAITPKDIEQEFRRRGVWTYDDMNQYPQQVMAALNALSNRTFANLMRLARTLK